MTTAKTTQALAQSLDVTLPEHACQLAAELEEALGGTGTHASLKIIASIAAAAVLKDSAIFRALMSIASGRGYGDALPRALAIATTFLHAPPQPPREATTKLVVSALERGLRMAPSTRTDRVDPLLAACTDVVEMVNALSVQRFAAALLPAASPPSERAATSQPVPSSEGRRITRDFATPVPPHPESAPATSRPAPPRSTMRPSAHRGTLRPGPTSSDMDANAVLVPRTQVRDAPPRTHVRDESNPRPLKKKW
jgi:hypothetical protein